METYKILCDGKERVVALPTKSDEGRRRHSKRKYVRHAFMDPLPKKKGKES